MKYHLIGLLVAGIMVTGCQNKTFPEQGMDKGQWLDTNPTADRVYHDRNMEIWNQGQHCYYFMKGSLVYAYQCGNLSTVD